MRTGLKWVGLALSLGVAASSAQAMPIAPAAVSGDAAVVLVADGCGPYAHRSHYGYCKSDGYYGAPRYYGPPRVFAPPPPYYYARHCYVRNTYYGPRRICN